MMKVAINIESVGARRGGAEKYAGTVARWLARAGHEVHVFARDVEPDELPPGTPVHFVRPNCPPGLGWLRAYQFARESERVLRSHDFDLIIGFNKVWYVHVYLAVGGAHWASLDCSSRRYRSGWMRGLWRLSKWLSPKQWVFGAIARRQFGGVHQPHVIAPARIVAEHFQEYHAIPRERISVVYNALDARESADDRMGARQLFRARLGLGPEDVAVLFVARNYELKGLEPLLYAFAARAGRLPGAQLVVCGSARQRRFCRLARHLGVSDRVSFLGFVPDVAGYFAAGDIFAFPTFYDPCSLVVLEAMQAGLPVITTRQNGAGELLSEGQDGFVVSSPWAVDELGDRIAELIRNPALRRRMGARARERVCAFTVEARQREMLEALERAAADRRAAPALRDAA